MGGKMEEKDEPCKHNPPPAKKKVIKDKLHIKKKKK